MSTIQVEGLWQFIQTLMLSNKNKQWLADKLIESTQPTASSQKETDYILASEEMKRIITEGDEQITKGEYQTIDIDTLWR